jgi:hypothetical protein
MSARDAVDLSVGQEVLRYEGRFMENPWEVILITNYEVLQRSPGWEVRIIYKQD